MNCYTYAKKKCNKCHKYHKHSTIMSSYHQEEKAIVSEITTLDPAQGPSSGGNPIIINGCNLMYTEKVSINTINVPFTMLSNNKLQIIAPPSINTRVQILVYFKNGSYDSKLYTYIESPIITSLNPSAGPMTGSNTIIITGTGLSSTISIYFGTIPTFNFIVISDYVVQTVVPNLFAKTSILIHVVTSGGSSNILTYSLIPPPII